MQILTIWKRFQPLKCKLEPLERGSKHLNGNSNHSKGIQSIRIQILTFRIKCFVMQILTIRKGFKSNFEPLERDSKHLNANTNHSKGIRSIRI